MRVSEWIPKSVVFLGMRTVKNRVDHLKLGGTGFVVSVPWERPTSRDERHLYLVTARHCVLALRKREHEVRVNATDGTWKSSAVPPNTKWWFHPTEENCVDIAVRPFDVDEADIVPIPLDLLLTNDDISEYYVGQGDEVTVTGLFTKVAGASRNMPIVRRGTLAMMPEDMIPIKVGNEVCDAEAYLVEVRSIGGASGSPVFVRAPVGVQYNVHTRSGKFREAKAHVQGDYFLLGLMQGHWEIRPDQKNKDDLRIAFDDEASINLGIAIVVPAKKIREVINHPELIAMRKKTESERGKSEGSSTPDDAFRREEVGAISKRRFERALKRVSRKPSSEAPSRPEKESPGT